MSVFTMFLAAMALAGVIITLTYGMDEDTPLRVKARRVGWALLWTMPGAWLAVWLAWRFLLPSTMP